MKDEAEGRFYTSSIRDIEDRGSIFFETRNVNVFLLGILLFFGRIFGGYLGICVIALFLFLFSVIFI